MSWEDLSVLVTGGTGSFGRKFAEVALKNRSPKRLIIFSRDELKQHEMRAQGFDHPSLRYFIGDIRELDRLKRALDGVDIVVHAAALKQVPACEYNPFEAVKTNIIGTQNVIEASIDSGVQKVMAISSDKAVNPVNLYGATKLCAEKMVIQGNAYAGKTATLLSCCRYGNVVNSRGSVIPLFLSQRESGKITITDPAMTRFWLTLEQGTEFVMSCIDRMHGGEVFVPKIPSMAITEVAKAIAPESDVEYIGMRPGEKVHEVLISSSESRHTVELDTMFVVLPLHPWWDQDRWPEGKPLDPGFTYSSDTNSDWLSGEGLLAMVDAAATDAQISD